ncbi:MAG: hypothetical protein PWQ97_1628 [Tepidanaerobacteraceae bacterium]|nr:hypothetical protein [Tepidanaerobacteraceae bacterium]
MDIRKMKYFISAAELLSFTKAAKRHYIAQTAMSQQIAAIEAELDVVLFDRSKHKIELTPAGETFLKECKIIVELYENAVKKTKAVYMDSAGIIRVGYSGPSEKRFLPEILKLFQEKYPNVDLSLEEDSFLGLSDKLEKGILDLIFSLSYDIMQLKKVERVCLAKDEMCLMVSKWHKKADKRRINAIEVAEEKIIMINRDYGPYNFEHMLWACRQDGYEPNIVYEVTSMDTLILMVEANQGVAFMPKRLFDPGNHNVRLIELENSHHTCELELVWKKGNKNPFIKDFVKIAKDVYKRIE